VNRRRLFVCLAVIAAAIALYAAVVIRNFKGPIGDHVESFLYEYLSYYVSKNLSFGPLPHLNLDNDQAFYPFGTNVALQSFCVERDLFFTAVSRAFGSGPWLQLYYLLGLVVATYGTFALLRPDYGDVRATAAAILANCFNFYAAQKYPYHFNIACVHWSTLGIVCDFVLVSRLVERKAISLSLVLVRTLLIVLAFGLELGHVLGYSLTSCSLACVFAAGLLVVRARRAKGGDESDLARFARDARRELNAHTLRIGGLVVAIGLVAVLYGSLVFQIVRAAQKFDFHGVPDAVWWSQPIRLFIPYFPWIHPSQQPRFLRIWGDQAEVGIGSGGAGIFLLSLGVLGFVQAKRRLRYAPLVAMFVMFVVSRPGFDLVRWMPWFAFTRVFSRATIVYSTVLALLALGIDRDRIAERWRPFVLGAFGVVGALEVYTLGMIKMTHAAFAFDDAFLAHMKRIEALPGEAVLDFPFCILGGNGDQAHLCPYPTRLKSVYALQRFHHKKVIGQYLGRIHPSQVKPFVDEGWPKMWDPDELAPDLADHQERCLTGSEWTFFTDFYEENDFAGIQLAVDALPPGCAEKFYARFGQPMGEVSVPNAGRLAFIARDPSTFGRVDKEAAKKLRLSLDLGEPVEIVAARLGPSVDLTGFSSIEWLGPSKQPTQRWRWALAPASEVSFHVSAPKELVIEARLDTPLDGQRVTVLVDGAPIATWNDVRSDTPVERSAGAHILPGEHVVSFVSPSSNTPPTQFAPSDPRPMTVQFHSLVLRADPPP
jgi:hypothetical protein